MDSVLTVNGLTKYYHARRGASKGTLIKAVDGISFEVYPGEVVGFLGPNGAGKTTAIKAITGLASYSGSIVINGFDLAKDHVGALTQLGAIVENPDLYQNKTARWNLKYFASISDEAELRKGFDPATPIKTVIERRVNKALETVGLSERADTAVKTFSLGMKQRLGIAQALIAEPKLLILDEPANGLDPDGIKEIRSLIRELAGRGIGVFVSSHQLHEMQLMCDRVLIISHGKIVADKKIEDLAKSGEGAVRVTVRTDSPDDAARFVGERFGAKDVVTNANSLSFSTSATIAEITKELVIAGFNVYGVSEDEISLEDVFMREVHSGGGIKEDGDVR